MSELFDKLKKANTIKDASLLSLSKFFKEEFYPTGIPILNLALSARLDGGFTYGMTILAGASKTAKSLIMLYLAKQYLDNNKDSIFILYDCEFGTHNQMIDSVGIDRSRIYHKPLEDVEQLKIDLMKTLQDIDREDKVIIGVDSFGEIASRKETEDTLDGKTVADMSRAKALNSLFRQLKPQLNTRKVPLIGVGKTYKTQEIYAKEVLGGGEGMTKQADTVFFISKVQEKDGKEFKGSTFKLKANKGRLVRENSIFPLTILFESGIDKTSGLLELALETKRIVKPKQGWYQKAGEEKSMRKKEMDWAFWKEFLKDENFKEEVYKLYSYDLLEKEDLEIEIEQNNE